ncbi:unnamed protein product [Lymnaea stagnalis]|uniref:Uncharacterized protein n=1 Tax=Lymnaea stagnalis TaxID=6523 RepID=A0AAV2HQG3_LYMST
MLNRSCAHTNVTCINGPNNGTNLTLPTTLLPPPRNGTDNILVIATIGAPAITAILLALSIMTLVIYWKNRGRDYRQREDSYDFIKEISTPTKINQARHSQIESTPTTTNQIRASHNKSTARTTNQTRHSTIESTPTPGNQIRVSPLEVSSTVVT